MMAAQRKELLPGAYLTTICTKKFKTGMLSVNLMLPLAAETASLNALLPSVLRRGTAHYPDMIDLSAALDELYGAAADVDVRKRGEAHCIGFRAVFIDDAYAPGGENLLRETALFLGDLLLRPAMQNGSFCPAYFEGERENLLRRIRAQKNDRRLYARLRLLANMCAKEPYGTDRLGTEVSASSISPQMLLDRYQQILNEARIEFFYCGSASPSQVEQAVLNGFQGLPHHRPAQIETLFFSRAPSPEPKVVMEEMDISQARLALGYRSGIRMQDEDYPALLLFNAAFGGTVTSKLFANVRERMSLCYEIGSMVEKHKGLLLVAAGIAPEAYEKASDEIANQLQTFVQGKCTKQELEDARRALLSGIRSTSDSQIRLEDFYLNQAVAGLWYAPEDLAQKVSSVTADAVLETARHIQLDTIYFLRERGCKNAKNSL
ncbi:MAG: pitrilysin family protein [Oscillospiraceae bacterium]|nr:pitrilysin family protein [Oscillospiraceae bacterium]